MRGIIAYIRRHPVDDIIDHEPEPVAITPPPARSMVGSVVMSLGNALASYRNSATVLQAEIAAKNEALRQTQAAISSMEAALTNLAGDPALTDDERVIASEPIEASAVEQMEGALF